jgi:hypothetical protein
LRRVTKIYGIISVLVYSDFLGGRHGAELKDDESGGRIAGGIRLLQVGDSK